MKIENFCLWALWDVLKLSRVILGHRHEDFKIFFVHIARNGTKNYLDQLCQSL